MTLGPILPGVRSNPQFALILPEIVIYGPFNIEADRQRIREHLNRVVSFFSFSERIVRVQFEPDLGARERPVRSRGIVMTAPAGISMVPAET